jgi:2-methylisocitrate lyase-like PEP mutase family enzyme
MLLQQHVVENIKRLAGTGIAGFLIEDFSREHRQLYDFSKAIERVQVAIETVAELGCH